MPELTRLDEQIFVFAKKGSKPCDRYFDPSPFQSTELRRPYKPTKRLGASYRVKIDDSALTPSEKADAHRALDAVIQEMHDGRIFGFRMKIGGVHKLPWGGKSSGISRAVDRTGFSVVRCHTNTRRADNIVYCAAKTRKGSRHPVPFRLS